MKLPTELRRLSSTQSSEQDWRGREVTMPESLGNGLIGVGLLIGISVLSWRAWHRWNAAGPPSRGQMYGDSGVPGPELPDGNRSDANHKSV